ncbi:MAG: NAD(P)-dependent oxidoreductase [Hyphomicrobium sp.]|nr:NAD(P)-dependent oxidoreductase [Hyphomicrobium sp.]
MNNRPIGIIASDSAARPVAERLAACGQRVLLYQIDAAHHGKLPKNIEAAATPTDIGFDCEIVLSFIDDTTTFRELLIGTPQRLGLGAEMNPGAILVDFGVRPPRESQALLGVIGMRGVAILDAAFVGNTGNMAGDVEGGHAALLLGGFPTSVDQVVPILAHLGRVDCTGPLGSAHTAAALMGYMEAAHHIAHDEALSVGRALGIAGDALTRLLDGDTGTAAAPNIIRLAKRTSLALRLAQDRGVQADIIDFTGARLAVVLTRRS